MFLFLFLLIVDYLDTKLLLLKITSCLPCRGELTHIGLIKINFLELFATASYSIMFTQKMHACSKSFIHSSCHWNSSLPNLWELFERIYAAKKTLKVIHLDFQKVFCIETLRMFHPRDTVKGMKSQ